MAQDRTLPEQLRSWAEPYKDDELDNLLRQAAAEIERLRKAMRHALLCIGGNPQATQCSAHGSEWNGNCPHCLVLSDGYALEPETPQ